MIGMHLPPPLLVLFTVAALPALAASPAITLAWQTDADLKVPEGVLFDASRKVLYVSNIDGTQPWEKDSAGSIGRVGLDGKILAVDWVTGLHAPKGMALVKNRLYVADVDRVVVIDVSRGAIDSEIAVPDAQRLNDVSAGTDGRVYVSDSGSGRIFALEQDEVTVVTDQFKSPNGVLSVEGNLYVLDQETLWQVGADGKPSAVVRGLAGHVDGVEKVGPDAFVISCWNGIVYHATSGGEVTVLLDTREDKINAADIGFDPATRTIYVPTFWKNTIAAYRLSPPQPN